MSKSNVKRMAIMQEANIKECKVCKEKKLRILYGKFPSMNNKYVDEQGNLWSGKTCPPCNQLRIKEKMQKLRAGRKIKLSSQEVAIILDEQVNKSLGEASIKALQEAVIMIGEEE